ncbi:MAG TPA: hypothetical protein VIV63_10615 [Steroidobacteraceae bacterium]
MSNQQASRETESAIIPRRFAMKRSAEQYAVLSPLLDEALRLDDAARVVWLAKLPEEYASYRPALGRILTMDSAHSQSHLNGLELRLRSCSRGVGVLVLAEVDRRKMGSDPIS